FILDQCYLDSNPQYCNLITLTGGNSIETVDNIDVNVGEVYTSGVDVNASYTFPETSIGTFGISTNWTFVRSFVNVIPDTQSPTGFESIDAVGDAGSEIPQRRGQVNLNWDFGDWAAVWNIQFISKVYESCTATTIELNECSQPNSYDAVTQTTGKNELGTTIYNDAAITYRVAPINADFTLGIQNLFNKQFPVAHTVSFPANFESEMGYRIPGRFFYARVGVKF
ncbi:MAG: TonB-dependent receptor domain-containing protein, partial [Gammaproteobacteria bacterium]